STFTSFSQNSNRYINNVTTLNANEQLTDVSVKAPVGSTIKVYAYKITGTSGSLVFEQLHHFGSFITTSEIHTQIIEDDYKMQVGTYIGISSSGGVYYKSMALFGTHSAINNWTNIGLAHSFTTK